MNKSKNLKTSNDEANKYFDPCINYKICKGKWYKYRAKQDDGICKACIKNDKNKEKCLEKGNNFHYNFDCNGCGEKFVFQKKEYCQAGFCKKCFDNLSKQ